MSVTPPTVPYEPKGTRRWLPVWAWVLCCVTAFLVGGSILLPTMQPHPHENYTLDKCGSDLRGIGQAVQLYANENRGHLPPEFRLLWTTQDIGLECVVCPSTDNKRPTSLPSPEEFDSTSDYIYLGAGLTIQADPNIVVAHDRPANHGDKVNVLFADGRVERISTADLPQLLAKSAALRAATTRPAR